MSVKNNQTIFNNDPTTPTIYTTMSEIISHGQDQSAASPATPKRTIKARHTIDELMEQTDFEVLAGDENLNDWLKAKPVGRERW
jgi:hypothetical protein